MNPPKKQHSPGHLRARQQQPLKSGCAQLKCSPVKPQIKHPIAPPVYRPQPTPRVLQTKAVGNFRQPPPQVGQKPLAPPVRRPQPVPHVLQRKTAVGQPPPGQSRPQPPKPPAILRPAAKNIAQPKMGPPAQRLSPPPAIQRAGVVQRYQAVDGGGAVDQFTFDERAGEASRGFNGWGSLNRGWARVITATGATHIFRANSIQGVAHAEEALLALVFAAYPNIRNDRPDPNVGGVNRLVELYTERQPCTADTADYQRTQRHNTNGNCHAYLTAAVHDSVRVSFSVAHSDNAHVALMNSARQIYANQIASGARRLTLGEATNNNIHNYQTPIRQRCHALHGHYGRDYEGDLNHYNQLLGALTRECGALCKIMGIDIVTPLRQAFEAGAHAAGSDPVRAAMDAAAQQIRNEAAAQFKAFFSEPFSFDKDKKPPAPPTGGGGEKAPLWVQ